MTFLTDQHFFWYLSRAAGLSAYLVLFVNVVLGLLVRTRFGDRFIARWQSFDLHQFTSFVAIGLIALHAGALLGDHYIGFTLAQILLPFASTFRPLETAYGVIAMYLIVITTASFWLKRFIGQRGWRKLHYATFGAYVLAAAHGVTSGTDTTLGWAWAMYWVTGWVVAVLTIWRVGERSSSSPPRLRRGLTMDYEK